MQLPAFRQLKVLVVGDVMLDRYWYGDTSRISPEAPVPVVNVDQHEERPGGAANVALNLAALGVKVFLVGWVGDDEAATRLEHLLREQGIEFDLQRVPGRDTITKLRVLSRHQQLIRLDFEKGLQFGAPEKLCESVAAALGEMDALILSDYAKGSLADAPGIIDLARAAAIPVIVDPKGRDFGKYRGATVITPNMAEFETVAGPVHDDTELVEKAEAMRNRHEWEALLVTRGARGMSLIQAGSVLHLPAHAQEVFDVTGAGDTVVAVLAAGLAGGMAFPEAVSLSNIAASRVVAKLGAATISEDELRHAMVELLHPPAEGILNEEQLSMALRSARARGERIVMTNGCFDILHAGHVDYLQKARNLGDRLIVAVNDDASVQRLKGKQRPITVLAERMEVLSALSCVDWVVAFGDDTPERLICKFLPDVLVKGADYQVEQIAGHRCVLDHGGQVITLQLRAGNSTTAIIEKIREQNQ